jgi:hypothetical protein
MVKAFDSHATILNDLTRLVDVSLASANDFTFNDETLAFVEEHHLSILDNDYSRLAVHVFVQDTAFSYWRIAICGFGTGLSLGSDASANVQVNVTSFNTIVVFDLFLKR